MVFPQAWLDAKAEDDGEGRTNREVVVPVRSTPPSTCVVIDVVMTLLYLCVKQDYRHRIAFTRPQTPLGTFSQMAAGLTHHVSPARLRRISRSIPKILILTGDDDNLIRPSESVHLSKCMPEAEFVQWKGVGHGIHIQEKRRFHASLERVFEEGRGRVGEGYVPGGVEVP